MRTIILAGGLGTRLAEETDTKPKPMVLLDEKPMLWHIMNIYASQGFKEFAIAAGYMGEVITHYVRSLPSDWDIQVLDTGLESMTAGRIKQCIQEFPDKEFFVTYGDGLGNVHLRKLIAHHNLMGRLATLTSVRPPARFGVLEKRKGLVTRFGEKRQSDVDWINGGFFLINREVADQITSNNESFEIDILPILAKKGMLAAFEHEDFWQPMDTLREKKLLSELAKNPIPPWLNLDLNNNS